MTEAAAAEARMSEAGFALGFAALCAILALGFFRDFVFQPGTMPFGSDMIEEAFPLRNFAVEEVRAGRPLPVWNPFAYSGIPFLETLPYPVYYPTSLLYFVMSLGRAIGWTFVLHFALAGLLMFAFARRLRISRWGAALAGLAFMFNAYTVSHLYAGQDGRIFAMVLIPLVFFCLRAGLDTRRLGPYLLMGGAVALQIFTPHVQLMYFSSLAACAYFAAEAAGIWRREGARAALAEGGRFAAGFVVAAAVAAVELLPTATFLESAVRGAQSGYAYASSWAMPPAEVTALVAPDLMGSLQTYWGSNPFKLHSEYLGAVPLVLALAGLLWGGRRRTLFWGALAVVALLFAMGAATPVHRLAYALVPMIKSFRAPSMMMALVAFAVATLAGIGFDALTSGADGRGRHGAGARGQTARWGGARTALFFGASALVALLWVWAAAAPGSLAALVGGASPLGPDRAAAQAAALRALPGSLGLTVVVWLVATALGWGSARGRVGSLTAGALLAALLIVDLWRIDARYLSVVPIEATFAPSPAERFLMEQERPFRILPLAGSMGPNEAILHRLESVTGLQKFRLEWYSLLQGGSAASNLGKLPLWRVLNLRYLVSARPLESPELERVFEGPPAVYRWKGDAPRARLVGETRVVGDEEALRLLEDPAFDVGHVALLAQPLPAGAGGSVPGARGEPVGSVRYLSSTPSKIEAEVTASAPSLAVFYEVYHPFWQARLDGRPVSLARVDLAFRGVPVPAGTHRITMAYEPRAFERGRSISLAALAAGLGYAAGATWRRRSRKRHPDGARSGAAAERHGR